MVFYHCSPVQGLTVLIPSANIIFGGEKVVCMAALRAMALMYGIRHCYEPSGQATIPHISFDVFCERAGKSNYKLMQKKN